MKRRALALLCAMLLGGCGTRAPLAVRDIDAAQAAREVAPGRSRAQVLAALGPTTSQRFDSGYEVWLYRLPGRHELVILFGRDGLVRKSRSGPVLSVPPAP